MVILDTSRAACQLEDPILDSITNTMGEHSNRHLITSMTRPVAILKCVLCIG